MSRIGGVVMLSPPTLGDEPHRQRRAIDTKAYLETISMAEWHFEEEDPRWFGRVDPACPEA